MNLSMLLILFGISAEMLQAATLLRRLGGDHLCQSGQVYDYPYNNGNIKICQNGETVLNYVGREQQCHCPQNTWNDNYSGRCITSCNGRSSHPSTNNNLCQTNSGQIYDYPYNNGHVKICLNGQTVLNFIGNDKQCHCPQGTWNDNYKGNCIDYCPLPVPNDNVVSGSSNLCQIGSGQIYGVPYNNGFVKICQNGQTVLNYVGTNAQCHCPQGTWNDNYNGQCIHSCQLDDAAHGENNNNLCQIGSGQIFGIPYNNGNVKICQNGQVVYNFIGLTQQCHCPYGTFNDNFTGQCIEKCEAVNNNNNNLCQNGSGQIFGAPYNNGYVKICQNGETVFNFIGTTQQCHCPENKWNDNYAGQCIDQCH